MIYKHIKPKLLSGAIGAEVYGIDLINANNDVWKEIHKLYLDRLVLFFPEQILSPPELVDIVRHFGPVSKYLFAPLRTGSLLEEPLIYSLVKETYETWNIGNGWHTDTTFADMPPKATAMYSIDVPLVGGDTLFANMYLAYDALSNEFKKALQKLRAVHNSEGRRVNPRPGKNRRFIEAIHPLVRTHPETYRKVLYVDALHTVGIEGWKDEESQPLLEYLYKCQQQPEFTCRYRWTPNVLAIWDNCAAQHYAINDYHGYRREMYRLSVVGGRPV